MNALIAQCMLVFCLLLMARALCLHFEMDLQMDQVDNQFLMHQLKILRQFNNKFEAMETSAISKVRLPPMAAPFITPVLGLLMFTLFFVGDKVQNTVGSNFKLLSSQQSKKLKSSELFLRRQLKLIQGGKGK